MPETPAPTMARSSPAPRDPWNRGSAEILCTARAPLSALNLSSGMPVRSPTTYRPGTAVLPSSCTSGSLSTVPAGQRVWSQCV